MSCDSKEDCCDGLHCIPNNRSGKQCRKLPTCMKNWDDCSVVGCCGKLKCVHNEKRGTKQCRDIPGCWNRQNKDCSNTPCCDGLTCIKGKDDRQLCKKLPKCQRLGRSCEYVKCCDDANKPMQCVEVKDKKGRLAKQCRLAPGDVEVFVWDDLNANGIQDDEEPGIEGVHLRLIKNKGQVELGDLKNGGNAHEEIPTDVNGKVLFRQVPVGKHLRVKVTKGPMGGIASPRRKGTDRNKDSDLQSRGLTSNFRLKQKGVYKGVALGYAMPEEAEIRVFNDLNGNGIQEEGELGIKNVELRLLEYYTVKKLVDPGDEATGKKPKFKKETKVREFTDRKNGGNAHEVLKTNKEGKVTFTEVPQGVKLKAKVVSAPYGAIPTKRNAGKDDTVDSDLRNDGTSETFYAKAGDNVDLGYRMPETVIVRVWDDTDGDGIQDKGEPGIEGVKLRLVLANKEKDTLKASPGSGNAHKEIKTNAEGFATFTKVPQGQRLQVKVTGPPKGAVSTKKNVGQEKGKESETDSDLNSNGLSDSFVVTSDGAPFSEIDLGYKMPGSMIVRVWDDANGNGIQDPDEVGIPDVSLVLVNNDMEKTRVKDQKNGGNAHKQLKTDENGFVSFTNVPNKERFRVKVTNAPAGAINTKKDQGGKKNKEGDSDLDNRGFSDVFILNGGDDYTEIDLGYRMPSSLEVRVWDDANGNGIQDGEEKGIDNVKLQLVDAKNGKAIKNMKNDGTAHQVLKTDENGLVTFTKVPKGTKLKVKVLNAPKGAVQTKTRGTKDKSMDSDLQKNSLSNWFDLSKFDGSTFGGIDLGYKMPDDVQIRVWDDANGNGRQDPDEVGIEGVKLRLLDKKKIGLKNYGRGSTAHKTLVTGKDGLVTFEGVPKDIHVQAKVINPPKGALRTKQNQKTDGKKDDANDSDLEKDNTSELFKLSSFNVDVFNKIDLGYRMPNDVDVFVFDDVNGNGIQDDDEPGIKGIQLQVLTTKNERAKVGGGSTCHEKVFTDENGVASFKECPKTERLKVVVLNAPPGSKATTRNQKKKGGTDENDSELRQHKKKFESDQFSLASFNGDEAYSKLDLGFLMPKTQVVRVWNDKNGNGVQDEDEEGIEGVKLRLVQNNKTPMPDLGIEGNNTREDLTTGADGRVTWYGVPQSFKMRVQVVDGLPAGAKVTKKNQKINGVKDEQLDSEANHNGVTDTFQLPADADELYDHVDLGYIVPAPAA